MLTQLRNLVSDQTEANFYCQETHNMHDYTNGEQGQLKKDNLQGNYSFYGNCSQPQKVLSKNRIHTMSRFRQTSKMLNNIEQINTM